MAFILLFLLRFKTEENETLIPQFSYKYTRRMHQWIPQRIYNHSQHYTVISTKQGSPHFSVFSLSSVIISTLA